MIFEFILKTICLMRPFEICYKTFRDLEIVKLILFNIYWIEKSGFKYRVRRMNT